MLVDVIAAQNPQQVPGERRTDNWSDRDGNDIESVRVHDNVISLKRATELHSNLQFSVKEIRAIQSQLSALSPLRLTARALSVWLIMTSTLCTTTFAT